MQATVYANLTTRRLTTTLGGSAISFPAFVQGDKVRIWIRPRLRMNFMGGFAAE